jgi:hypothetical protein
MVHGPAGLIASAKPGETVDYVKQDRKVRFWNGTYAYDQVITDEGGAKDMTAFCTVAKSIRELNGLDAPTKVDVKTDMTVHTDEDVRHDAILAIQRVREAKAEAEADSNGHH